MATKSRHYEGEAKPSQRVRDDYLALVLEFPLKAIHGDAHLHRAIEVIDQLTLIPERKLSPGQADYLEALSELVHSYEQAHHRIQPLDHDGIQTLALLLEQHDMGASDLGRLLGNRSLGSKVLRRERELSKAHISILAEHFKVSPSLFL